MNAFITVLQEHKGLTSLRRGVLATLQLNMGNLCNQKCQHCHVEASPAGKNIMSKRVIDDTLEFLRCYNIRVLDITGGAPELNPYFEYLVRAARPLVDELLVRSNLTVLFESRKEYLCRFFKENKVHLICSLPCYLRKNVEAQRGEGVFDKSIEVLRILNELGYSRQPELSLDLVYNPQEANLPPAQEKLEEDYKQHLRQGYGIEFNRLITITNVPIKRFKDYLQSRGEYERYYNILKDNFNPQVIDALMCRTFLSVGYDGRIYDCDFNQALGLSLKDERGAELTIDKINPHELKGREIILGTHCLSCTAGYGSGCQGALESKDERVLDSTGQSEAQSMNLYSESELSIIDMVKEYYGKILQRTKDLKTSACCSTDNMPREHRAILSNIEPEILNRFYGCGSPIPPAIHGCTVLDLGCGSGRDVYLAAALAGEEGTVIGVDMSDEQLAVARKYQKSQMERFGFLRCNVDFRKGYIESLNSSGIGDNSVDVVISNCVINLSPDKKRVFSEIYRVLKPGGELYFSDVFSGCRVPDFIRNDPVFYGECLGGALYIEDFRRLLRQVGFVDYRVVSRRRISLENQTMQEKAGMVDFYSMTIRAFKLNSLEDICEDYGQIAVYLGTVSGAPHQFILDSRHAFITGKPELVCGNTAAMLSETRYGKYFKVSGDRSRHFGVFACAPVTDKKEGGGSLGGGCC